MLCIQPELLKSFADLLGDGAGRRRPGPPVGSAGMFKPDVAAVCEMKRGLCEAYIYNVLSNLSSGEGSPVHTLG